MQSQRKTVLWSFLFGSVLLLTACPSQTNIYKINSDPARYRDKEVGIAGTVTESYGVLGTGAYELDGGTGKMWVIARRKGRHEGARPHRIHVWRAQLRNGARRVGPPHQIVNFPGDARGERCRNGAWPE